MCRTSASPDSAGKSCAHNHTVATHAQYTTATTIGAAVREELSPRGLGAGSSPKWTLQDDSARKRCMGQI